MNPKVKIIIEELFPKVIETHIRMRSSIEATKKSLDRYRTMGLQAIRNLPDETQLENRQALDSAYEAALKSLDEFHSQETADRSSLLQDTLE